MNTFIDGLALGAICGLFVTLLIVELSNLFQRSSVIQRKDIISDEALKAPAQFSKAIEELRYSIAKLKLEIKAKDAEDYAYESMKAELASLRERYRSIVMERPQGKGIRLQPAETFHLKINTHADKIFDGIVKPHFTKARFSAKGKITFEVVKEF